MATAKKKAVSPKKQRPAKKKATAKEETTPQKATAKKSAAPKKKATASKVTSKQKSTTKKKAATTTAPKNTPAKKAAAKKSAPAKKKTAASSEKTKAAQLAPKENTASKRTSAVSKTKMLPRAFLVDLATTIRDAVAPLARSVKAKSVVDTSPSGDATFELDRVAEKALLGFLKNANLPVAYYSEDEGYSTFTSAPPKYLLVVDPVDGSRAAKNGFEGCTVAIASTRVIERPAMADLDNACVVELLGARTFYAERGKGVRVNEDGGVRRPKLSENTNLETLSWAMTVPARPAELIFPTAARLIDLSSLKGGFFACNSTSYSLTRLITGQLDACVDFAGRYLRDLEELVEDYFINAGRGTALGICPYDLAAALLIAEEAGCIVTDAYGNRFDDVLLLDSSISNQQSLIAASNAELHKKLMTFFETRIKQFEQLLQRRADEKAAKA